MKRQISLYPLRPTNIEVLGNRVKESDPGWTGLDWSRAELRHRNKIAMPWCHPDDQTGDPEDFDCTYAVYPRPEAGKKWRNRMVKDVWFERDGKRWFVAVEFERPLGRVPHS